MGKKLTQNPLMEMKFERNIKIEDLLLRPFTAQLWTPE